MWTLQSKHIHWLVHVAAWGVLLGQPLFFTGSGSRETITSFEEYVHFLVMPLSFMVVFYANYLWLIPRTLFSRRIGRFVLGNVLLIGAVMLAVHVLSRHVLPPPPDAHLRPDPSWQDMVRFFARNAVLYLLVACVAVSIRMTGEWARAASARQELERVHAEAELQNLKSQLNPHFLFNTLNNIYSLIGLDAARAQQSVHELSRMLRYVLYDSSRPLVPLREEMDFLRNYVELMRLRVPRQVDVRVSLPDAPPAVQVAPLLFISLLENAFKHGVSSDGPSYVHISIEEDGSRLTCRIENSLFPKAEGQDRSGSGIGLKNLERRLELIYPGRHTFQHGAVGSAYMSYLEVDLR